MQNDVKTSEIGYRSTEIDLFLMMLFVNNFLENFVFWEIHLHVFQLHVHEVFQQTQQNVFSTGLQFRFWKLPNVFVNVFEVFGMGREDANG